MTVHSIEPAEVAEVVERYVAEQLADTRQYDNRSPLDQSGVWSLHRIAADIYALGFAACERTAAVRARGERERETPRESGSPS